MAEAWFGVHPSGPSTVSVDGVDVALASFLGDATTMSFLLKVLAIAAPLSLQLHPNLEQAAAGFARENRRGVALSDSGRVFRDANHKPELICALTVIDVLCGFRTRSEALQFLDALSGPTTTRLANEVRKGVETRDIIRKLLTATDPLLGVTTQERLLATNDLGERAGRLADRADCPESLRLGAEWLVKLAQAYPGDGGVAVAVFLNCVRVRPGDALYLAAGNMHAYLHGVGIEIMANSDNVVRGGLTPKHIDVDVLTELVDTEPSTVPLVKAFRSRLAGGARTEYWPVPVKDFSLLRVAVSDGETGILTIGNRPSVVLCSSGHVRLRGSRGADSSGIETACTLTKGQAVYAAPSQALHVSGYGEVFVAGSGEY